MIQLGFENSPCELKRTKQNGCSNNPELRKKIMVISIFNNLINCHVFVRCDLKNIFLILNTYIKLYVMFVLIYLCSFRNFSTDAPQCCRFFGNVALNIQPMANTGNNNAEQRAVAKRQMVGGSVVLPPEELYPDSSYA